MDDEPVCDCGDEPPDPCEDNETCCNGTTCVANSTFQTDSNNCGGCNNVCPPGQTCVAGGCTGGSGDMGCCTTYACTYLEETGGYGWLLTSRLPAEGACPETFDPTTEDPACCTDVSPEFACVTTALRFWSAEPCPSDCNSVFLICEGFFVNEPGWQPPPPPYTWILDPGAPNNACNAGCIAPAIGAPCNNYGDGQEETCGAIGDYNPASQLAFKEEPCSQEECEAHVSTWMAEPSGEPNEEGLYKVNWVLLDGCPGLCCSDQPTQPEFVKTSIIVDAPCKCGCA